MGEGKKTKTFKTEYKTNTEIPKQILYTHKKRKKKPF